ncbi:hypothetical protein D9M69_489840 [compost metagenome]
MLAKAARQGLPFDKLPAAQEYDEAMSRHRSEQDRYFRTSSAAAHRRAGEVQAWVNDLLAVLGVRAALGADAVADAAEAGNKTMAATALDLIARDKLSAAGAQGLPVLAAGRGLMVIQSAGVDAGALALADLEELAACAGMAIYPASIPGYGLGADPLEFRLHSSIVRVDASGALLLREAQTEGGGRVMLPHSVLGATSKQAGEELKAAVTARQAAMPHRFAEAAVGNSTLEQARRRENGKALAAYAATLQ